MFKMEVRTNIKDNTTQSSSSSKKETSKNKIGCDLIAEPCDSNIALVNNVIADMPGSGDPGSKQTIDNLDCDVTTDTLASDFSNKFSSDLVSSDLQNQHSFVPGQVASTSGCTLDNKNNTKEAQANDMENNEILLNVLPSASSREPVDAILIKQETDSVKQESEISESDIQSTCSTGNLNESRESVFYSDQSSESNAASAAVVKNVDNTSLCNLLIYTSEDSESDSSTDEELEDYESSLEERTLETPTTKKGKQGKSNNNKAVSKISETLRAMGALSLKDMEDLPPVPDPRGLKVEVPEKDCEQMGTISSIIDEIVMVESLPNMPAYDSDTLLFLDKGKQPLGYVYDIIGPVSQPLYAIRFNTTQEIQALNITKGLPVYSAPKTEHSQFVFLKQLMSMKGSDASWKNDEETPSDFVDYSDDEVEEAAKKGKKGTSRKTLNCNKKRNSLERHQNFEKDMNVRNLIDTRLHKIRDTYEPANKKYAPHSQQSAPQNFAKRGYPFPQIWNRPAFSFTTQPNNSGPVPSFAQMPHVSGVIGTFAPRVTPALPIATFGNLPPNVATFVPHIPPPMLPAGFRPNIPPPPLSRAPLNIDNVAPPPMFQNFPPPTTPSPVGASKQPDTRQTTTPLCMYPTNLGLPRPQTMTPQPQMLVTSHSGNSMPPNLTFYRPPQMQQWFTFPNPMGNHPPTPHGRSFNGSGRGFYPHKRP